MLTPPRVEPSPPNTRPSEGSSDLVSVIQQRWSAIPSRAPTISDENIIFLSKVAQAVRENNPGELPWHRLSEGQFQSTKRMILKFFGVSEIGNTKVIDSYFTPEEWNRLESWMSGDYGQNQLH